MNANNNWKNAIRVVHLLGGLRAVNNPGPSVIVSPNTIDNKIVKFQLSDYPSLVNVLKSLKLRPLGIDFYQDPEEVEGKYPPKWYSLSRVRSPNYTLNDSIRAWSNIRFSAHIKEDYFLSDVAGRIGFELQACEIRLRDISNSYNKELSVLSKDGSFENGKRFQTRNTLNIYLTVHSFLVEACSLRDYMAEFIRLFVFPKYRDTKISTMGSLRNKVLKHLYQDDDFARELYQATDPNSPGGWIANLGEYRDLVVHSMPLTEAGSTSSYLIQRQISIESGHYLPSIALPLPDNPGEIYTKKTQGINFSSYDEWFRALQENTEKSKSSPDALEYCYLAYDKLVALSTKLITYSPIKPELPVIKPEDIIC